MSMGFGLGIFRLSLSALVPFLASLALAAEPAGTAAGTGSPASVAAEGKASSGADQPLAEGSSPHPAISKTPTLDSSLLFRRVLVPEAQIKDWPRGNLRYLPIDAAEFERLL